MRILGDVGTADIKEPFFDRPEAGDPGASSISEGTRVNLKYHGKEISAQVTAIERLGTSFVGRVRRFAPPETSQDELSPGDHIRFRARDVCRVD